MSPAPPSGPLSGHHEVRVLTTASLGDTPVRLGNIVHASAVSGANILRDMREAITNTIGGQMTRYEVLLDRTIERALEALRDKAAEAGYDGVLDVRISHPHITDGAVEVVVAGTGFNYATPDT